jgi:hypothetical protein
MMDSDVVVVELTAAEYAAVQDFLAELEWLWGALWAVPWMEA